VDQAIPRHLLATFVGLLLLPPLASLTIFPRTEPLNQGVQWIESGRATAADIRRLSDPATDDRERLAPDGLREQLDMGDNLATPETSAERVDRGDFDLGFIEGVRLVAISGAAGVKMTQP
jgi:hypothetical protein